MIGCYILLAYGRKKASYNYLAQLASELDCANQIKFLGFKNNIKDFYQESSIFVLSSRYEGFGLVLIEAMSQGCAPIACDYKGRQKEILGSEENGITCDPDDVDSLARAICLVVKNDDLRHQMQKHALERSRYYSVEDSVKRWESLIAQVCDKKAEFFLSCVSRCSVELLVCQPEISFVLYNMERKCYEIF